MHNERVYFDIIFKGYILILFLWILIQIIGESLPISSSGHVQLMQKIGNISLQDAWIVDFLLHGPTIIILLLYFFSSWWNMIFPAQKFKEAVFFLFIADSITTIFWALKISSYSLVQSYFLPIGFFITALCLYFSYYIKGDKTFAWSKKDAVILGLVQSVSLLPGISRFAATYWAGIWLGYEKRIAVVISFFIQMPLLCAGFLKGGLALRNDTDLFLELMQPWVFLTVLLASVISYFLFCLVLRLIEKNRLWYGAYYMVIPIIVSLFLVKEAGL